MFSTCEFDWASGDSTKNAWSLTSGWQVVTITHMDGCVVVDSVLVPESAPVLDSATVGNIMCATDPYASSFIQLHLNDPINTGMLWSNMETMPYIDSLDAGMYQVALYDSLRGCSHLDSMVITAPDTLQLNVTSSNLQCYGDDSGTITATVTGGLPGYSYDWSNGDSTATISNLGIGYYDLVVLDSAGCPVTIDSIELTQPPQIVVNITSYWNDSIGTCDGGAVVTFSGGIPPLNPVWNDPNMATNDTVVGLCNGTYMVTVTDSSGCTSTDTVTILNTLGIDDLQSNQLILYPNPTKGLVVLSSTFR